MKRLFIFAALALAALSANATNYGRWMCNWCELRPGGDQQPSTT
jgi:hypothetical protein